MLRATLLASCCLAMAGAAMSGETSPRVGAVSARVHSAAVPGRLKREVKGECLSGQSCKWWWFFDLRQLRIPK